MSAPSLIPAGFWFRYTLPCPRLDAIPRRGKASPLLLDLPATCRLPALGVLEGREPFADLRTAWNTEGLGIAVEVPGVPAPPRSGRAGTPAVIPEVHLWIDTRDTRDIHRASRFCHLFSVRIDPATGDRLDAQVIQGRIHRAQADPPPARPDTIRNRVTRVGTHGWRLELFFQAAALHGFDPASSRRLGFLVHVADPRIGDQRLGVGPEFPIGEDPSLWATLELRDPP
jgi:hypothetical protein